MSDETLEELITEFRSLADEAENKAERRKEEVDFSEVDTSHMALAETQGQRKAFVQAWRLAISKREQENTDE